MAKSTKDSRIPQLGTPVSRIPLVGSLSLSQNRSIPRPINSTENHQAKFFNKFSPSKRSSNQSNTPSDSACIDFVTPSRNLKFSQQTANVQLENRLSFETSNDANLNSTNISKINKNLTNKNSESTELSQVNTLKSPTRNNANLCYSAAAKAFSETTPTSKHIGQQVVVCDSQLGTLKFLGNVQFDSGIWCGIELNNPIGKHNGIVQGVRYFSCQNNHGLLAPISKVRLTTPSKSHFEKLKLKFENYNLKLASQSFKLGRKLIASAKRDSECEPAPDTTDSQDSQSGPFSFIDVTSTSYKNYIDNTREISSNSLCTNQEKEPNDACDKNNSCDRNPSEESSNIKPPLNRRLTQILTKSSFIFNQNEPNDKTSNDEPNISSPNKDSASENVQIKQLPKSKSKTINSSLETKSCSNASNHSVPINIKQINKCFYESQQSTSSPGSALQTSLLSSTPILTITSSSLPNSTFASPEAPVTEPVFPDSNCLQLSKQNSVDESLEILTPDQMCDFPKTPSTDELKSLMLNLKKLDKTASNLSIAEASSTTDDSFKFSKNLAHNFTLKPLKKASSNFSVLEQDESLGILTPDLISDFPKTPSTDDLKSLMFSLKSSDKTLSNNSRTPSSENIVSFNQQKSDLEAATEFVPEVGVFKQEEFSNYPSPTGGDGCTADLSLELLQEDILSSSFLANNTFSNLETTMNMDLPLDSVDCKRFKQFRCEQTPSPEDLPLDPIGIKTDIVASVSTAGNSEADAKKPAKTSNSYIMSITSITSLDNGYQGDGEMSRPASRGGDHSPTVHKPSNQGLAVALNQFQRAMCRRPDPMTDSDFFTESDADGHDENAPKGDRRAQVIDGHLYGPNAPNPGPGPGEEIFVNNQNHAAEEMDSSGIFTDLDTNTRADEFSDAERNKNELQVRNVDEDQSPSDISSKTISENSQNRIEVTKSPSDQVQSSPVHNSAVDLATNALKDSNSLPGSAQSSPSRVSSLTSPKRSSSKEEPSVKKHKVPRREVVSKVKSMLETKSSNSVENRENRKPTKKTNNKWDAVMSKISDNKSTKPNLKEIKSKVACGLSASPASTEPRLPSSTPSKRSTVLRQNVQKSPGSSIKTKRRTKLRCDVPSKSSTNLAKQPSGSIHSSLSDISNSGRAPSRSFKTSSLQSINRSAKKASTRCVSPVGGDVETIRTNGTQGIASSGNGRYSRPNSASKKSSAQSNTNSAVDSGATTTPAYGQRRETSRRLMLVGASGKYNTINASKDPNRSVGANLGKVRPPLLVPTIASETRNASPTSVPERRPIPPSIVQAATANANFQHAAKGVEALGILLQHLVYQYDAFKMPCLKRDFENLKKDWTSTKLDLDETRSSYRRLEDQYNNLLAKEEVTKHSEQSYLVQLEELNEKHRLYIADLTEKFNEEKSQFEQRLDKQLNQQKREFLSKIEELQSENSRLSHDYETVLKDCNDAKNDLQVSIKKHTADENLLKDQIEKLTTKLNSVRTEQQTKESALAEKLDVAQKRIILLEDETRKVVETFKNETKDSKLQSALNRCTQLQDETESLRCVLDIKQNELADLRKIHAEAARDAEQLPAALLSAQTLKARVEDLELQLERKTDAEKQLLQEKKMWLETAKQESEQKKRLLYTNEELRWKLKQNYEVVTTLLSEIHNQTVNGDSAPSSPKSSLLRSFHSSSFSEKHSNIEHCNSFDSFKERLSQAQSTCKEKNLSRKSYFDSSLGNIFDLDNSSSNLPKIKAVVEKSDSVSYVLDMDESSEVLANRLYRKSFRNSLSSKNTPTKSSASKRLKLKTNHPLSLSASETSIGSESRGDIRCRSKSVSDKNNQHSPKSVDDENDRFTNSWDSFYSQNGGNYTPEICRVELGPSEIEIDSLSEDLIIVDTKNEDIEDVDYSENNVDYTLPALPSELNHSQTYDKKPDLLTCTGDMRLMQSSSPKNCAGEAMISESNSEDECSTSISSERSHSLRDAEHCETLAKTAAEICEKASKMQFDLMLMTDAINPENFVWSNDM